MSILSSSKTEGLKDVTNTTTPALPDSADTQAEKSDKEPAIRSDSESEKLYAGKFKTIEDLERSYAEAQKLIGEKSTKFTEVSNKLKEYEAPSEYVLEIELADDMKEELITIAKDAGLNQQQFKKITDHLHSNSLAEHEARQKANQEVLMSLGEEKVNRLDTYIDNNYPKKLAAALKDYYRHDKEIAQDLYKARESALNVTFKAGIAGAAPNTNARQEKMRELALKMNSSNPLEAHRARQEFEQLSKSIA